MALIAMANQMRVPVVVDPKGENYRKYRGATLLTPNRKEAQLATGIEISDSTSLEAAGKALCASLALNALLITRSEEGMSVFYPDGRHIPLPTVADFTERAPLTSALPSGTFFTDFTTTLSVAATFPELPSA